MWWNLIPDEVRQNTEFIYNLSYGKDSFAGLHVTIDILGIPVHRIVHAEVWATDTIPADLPPMVEFKAKADTYIKARWGLTVEHIYATRGGRDEPSAAPSTNSMNEESTSVNSGGFPCSKGHGAKTGSNGQPLEKLTYEKLFYHIPNRKDPDNPNRGGYTGWPYQQGPWCNSKLKVRVDLGLPDQMEPMVQQRPQEGSHTAFPSAAPAEETGAPSSKPSLFSKPPATRGEKKYRPHLGHRS